MRGTLRTDCYPISILPRLSRLFLDYASSHEPLEPFYAAAPYGPVKPLPQSDVWRYAAIADLLEEQNRALGAGEATIENIAKLRAGASVIVTGQQVTLFGGPLFTLLKAATAIRRARDAGAVPIFWLATEDHDLEEADHVTLPERHVLRRLRLEHRPEDAGKPVGQVKLREGIRALVDEAAEMLGPSEVLDAIEAAYRPETTYAEAFGRLLTTVFAGQGLIVIDAAGREFHRLGDPVLKAAIERAAELEDLLLERTKLLEERGYEAQVLVAKSGSLLFLIDDETGARVALKRRDDGSWSAGKKQYSTAELLGILESEPERLSANALLRPVFQDAILPTAAYVGGPAEISYFAQSQVVYEAVLGKTTPALPRLSATLVEPAIAKLMAQHEVRLEDLIQMHPDELAQRLGARAMPIEGKQKLAAAGNALDAELKTVTKWMAQMDAELGRSADVAANKMRYQMNRLRRLAANYQLQKEASIRKHVDALYLNLYPNDHPQERVVGMAAFLAKQGLGLVDQMVELAGQECPGHKVAYL
ncbi:MAG TPA: bacillithiol biosynthesis cysteine-adding enzyme BshC [Acidobacteriaceae bacterium]|nr:bacillithiol biosynthesis cysteine-adding enzyme BshC [Acidobacteriaceae bacterium]